MDRPVRWVAPFLFLGVLGLYLSTSYPSLSPYRDSGDLAASACSLGVAHPSGYPLYSLVGSAFLRLCPWGNPAYILNLASAVCVALAAAWLFLRFSGVSFFTGIFAALLFSWAPSVWSLGQVSEMYALHVLLGACLSWAAWQSRWLLAAFLWGLGCANHQSLILLAPAILYGMFRESGTLRSARHAPLGLPTPLASGRGSDTSRSLGELQRAGRNWALFFFFFLLGLSVYLYLPLRSLQDPVLHWGEPRTFRNFFRLVLRSDLGGLRLHPEVSGGAWGWREAGGQVALALSSIRDQLGWPGTLLAFWGAVAGRKCAWVRFAVTAFLFSGPLFLFLANLSPEDRATRAILEPHWVLPVFFGVCLAAWGWWNLRMRWGRGLLGIVIYGLGVGILGAAFAFGISGRNQRANFAAYDYAQNLFQVLPPQALLVSPDDPTAFALSYWQVCRSKRPDVVPILFHRTLWGYRQLRRRHPELLPEGEITSGQQLLQVLMTWNLHRGRPIYADLPQKFSGYGVALPSALTYRLVGSLPDPVFLRRFLDRARLRFGLLAWRGDPPGDFFTHQVTSYLASSWNNLGVAYLRLAPSTKFRVPAGRPEGANVPEVPAAVFCFRKALSLLPGLSESWNNLGNAALQEEHPGSALGYYRQGLRGSPRDARLHYHVGLAQRRMGRLGEAESAFRRALQMGDLPEAKNDLGLLYFQRGRMDRALSLWEELIREHPRFAPAQFNLGLAYGRRGDSSRALEAYQTYLRLVSDPDERREALEQIKKLDQSQSR
ncbi:MAG: DUF2723 domain-containing protein [Elusimicrobia bacterium]|nr:DUF2723 domain-containing protein [Elusimicrobiota bacterium]